MSCRLNRCGLAALSDVESAEWRDIFKTLEAQQDVLLARESEFRSPEYKWTRDPLHNWSRVWEYPYAYHHVREFRRANRADGLLRLADVGSGVTFFPFALARLGYEVTCVDVDPVCATDIPRAGKIASPAPGNVTFRLMTSEALPFEDQSLDVVICISVLEHIENFENTLTEMARVLKPGGLLVLTIDLDLRGDAELGVEKHAQLLRALDIHFERRHPERTIHPAELLRTCNGPYRLYPDTGVRRWWFAAKQLVKPLLGRKPALPLPWHLTVQGFALARRGPSAMQGTAEA